MTRLIFALLGVEIYLGIGVVFHAILLGGTINWGSDWSLGMLLGWPVVAVLLVMLISFLIFLACLVVFGIDSISTNIRYRRALRNGKK